MTIFESLKLHGLSLSQNLTTKGLIALMSNLPTYKTLFPEVFSMAETLQDYFDKYESALAALEKAREYVKQCESGVETAKDMYNKILNTPAAYTCPGGLTPKPIVPTATLQFYAAIETAQQILDQANKALDKAEEKVKSINSKIDSYKDKIITKLMTTKV